MEKINLLPYKEFLDQEKKIVRAPYTPEVEFYSSIKSGDIVKVRKLCKQPFDQKKGLGILSQNSLQSMKYHFVITASIVARYCIEGGMDMSLAYNLSDYYILKMDKYMNAESISKLHTIMCCDYTERMMSLKTKEISSKYIIDSLNYIYDHLHERITIQDIAGQVCLSPSYFSKLFKKEVGMTLSKYIQEKKIDTAKNMLAFSNYSLSQITLALAFPNQSYFTEIFRSQVGMTPRKYRNTYYRKS